MSRNGLSDHQLCGGVEVKRAGETTRQSARPFAFEAIRGQPWAPAQLNDSREGVNGQANRAETAIQAAVEIEKAEMETRRRLNPYGTQ